LEFGIRVVNKDTNQVGQVSDISVGGCFIRESEGLSRLPINNRVSLTFEIPGKDEHEDIYIDVEGRVIHHGQKGKGMGIKFLMIEPAVANAISRFVKAYL
jgi:c-di-GMP-binding flagellar brake protein YcgR